jgi:hypothetical protein
VALMQPQLNITIGEWFQLVGLMGYALTVLVPLRRRRAACAAAPGGAVDILIHYLWCLSRLGFSYLGFLV